MLVTFFLIWRHHYCTPYTGNIWVEIWKIQIKHWCIRKKVEIPSVMPCPGDELSAFWCASHQSLHPPTFLQKRTEQWRVLALGSLCLLLLFNLVWPGAIEFTSPIPRLGWHLYLLHMILWILNGIIHSKVLSPCTTVCYYTLQCVTTYYCMLLLLLYNKIRPHYTFYWGTCFFP